MRYLLLLSLILTSVESVIFAGTGVSVSKQQNASPDLLNAQSLTLIGETGTTLAVTEYTVVRIEKQLLPKDSVANADQARELLNRPAAEEE